MPTTLMAILGTSDAFDKAMGNLAVAYADQAEHDHAALKAAVGAGRIKGHIEPLSQTLEASVLR